MSLTRTRRFARPVVFSMVVAVATVALPTSAQPGPTGSKPVVVDDRTHGEPGRIERRLEWFFDSRRAGTTSPDEMAKLRLEAVEQTRRRIELQRQQSTTSSEAAALGGQNFWASKGPSPSSFGGWAFGNVSGRISALDADWAAGILYVGTASGGLWKSDNDGLSWSSIFDTAGTMTIGAVTVDPNDPNVIWAGTGENHVGCESYFGIGILRSPDGGQSWELRNGSGPLTLDNLARFADIVIDPRNSNHIMTGGRVRGCVDGAAAGGIFTTRDGGQTWIERMSGREVYEIQQDPAVLDTFWAATSGGVFKSTDSGTTWSVETGPPIGNVGRTELAISPSDPETVYALFSTAGGSIWRTTNGGSSWSERVTGSDACDGQCWYNMVLRVHNTNPNILYRGTVRLFKSTSAASSWNALTSSWGSAQKVHQDTHVLLMHPTQPDTFYVGSDGGLWKSTDGGVNFTNRSGNLNITQFYAIGTDASDPENVICGGAQDNSSLVRTTSDTWGLQFVSGDGFVCHIDPQNSDRVYITSYPNGGYPSIYRSTNGVFGGWSEITFGNGIVGGERSNWVTPYQLDMSSPNILYLGTQRMYRSTDHGSSWTPQGPGDMTGGSGSMAAIDINRGDPTHVVAGSSSGRVWRTENSGTDWVDISEGLPSRAVNDVTSDPQNPDRIFAVVGGFQTAHLWEWNTGVGWTARGAELPNVPTNTVVMFDSEDILVGSDTGVFRSVDGGATFWPYMEGLPIGLVVSDLRLDLPSLLTAGTYGRGAWQTRVGAVAADVQFEQVVLPFVEEAGDGDDKVEPGETWSFRPVLRNLGGAIASDLTARVVTSSPGITIEPAVGQYGNLIPGAAANPVTPYRFTVDPTFECGDTVVFDIVEILTSTAPTSYPDAIAAFEVRVVDRFFGGGGGGFAAPTYDQDFDGELGSAMARQIVGAAGTGNLEPLDASMLTVLDEEHGLGFRFAGAPDSGGEVWLHLGGTDSRAGIGVEIPANAAGAQLAIVHRYDLGDGLGRIVIDAAADGSDRYTTLNPDGHYPGDARGFTGSSNGWATTTFELTPYRGRNVHLAFVQESSSLGEGWEVDRVAVITMDVGVAICDVSHWPGSVVGGATFGRSGDDVQAFWGDACNIGELGGQSYSVQAGDLGALATGTFTHEPVNGACDLTSGATFTPGPGAEYYLIVPNEGGREGGSGSGSGGSARPQTSGICGEQREASCAP